jgi:predicted AlkP superfamily phosphohydrolase/phosphomutase
VVNLNYLLHQEGFLKFKKDTKSLDSLIRFLVPLARKLDIFKLEAKLPTLSMKVKLFNTYVKAQVDPNSVAFPVPGPFWGYVSLGAGISDDDKEVVIDRLGAIEDATTGEKIVRKIHRKEELYHGNQLTYLPDLILEPVDGYTFAAPPDYSNTWYIREVDPIGSPQVGTHHLDGIVVFDGDGVEASSVPLQAELLDVTPTILFYLDVPIPEYMDGTLLEGIFTTDFRESHVANYEATPMEKGLSGSQYSEEEEKHVRQRLRDLGYLD